MLLEEKPLQNLVDVFGYFLFFSARGRGRGSSRRQEGGGCRFSIENARGGGSDLPFIVAHVHNIQMSRFLSGEGEASGVHENFRKKGFPGTSKPQHLDTFCSEPLQKTRALAGLKRRGAGDDFSQEF